MKLKFLVPSAIICICSTYWLCIFILSFSTNFDTGHQILITKHGEENVIRKYNEIQSISKVNRHLLNENVTVFQAAVEISMQDSCDINVTGSQTIIDKTDATVLDTNTGLEWRRCPVGQKRVGEKCSSKYPSTMHTFADAKRLTSNFYFSGHNDWRVPTLAEITTVFEKRCGEFNISSIVYQSSNNHSGKSKDDGDILVDLTTLDNGHKMPASIETNGLQIVLDETSNRQGAVFLVRGGRPYSLGQIND